jgi:hypothetical protein
MKFARYLPALLILLGGTAWAGSFTTLRIGDVDGFGFGSGAGYVNTGGAPVNVDGSGVLSGQDYLPDLNKGGSVATGSGDDFDNRSASEKTGGSYQMVGDVIVHSVAGSDYTDIALSTSWETTFPNANDFPGPNGDDLPNQPGFVFDFFVADGDIGMLSPIYFNMVFGDYDVIPASVLFTRGDGTTFTQSVSTQPHPDDGLIQAIFATLDFSDVFTATTGGWDGYLAVDFVAAKEPYTAFDFVELSVDAIPPDGFQSAPLPAGAWMGLSMLGLLGAVRRYRRNRCGDI